MVKCNRLPYNPSHRSHLEPGTCSDGNFRFDILIIEILVVTVADIISIWAGVDGDP